MALLNRPLRTRKTPVMTAMMESTTRSSMSVKPRGDLPKREREDVDVKAMGKEGAKSDERSKGNGALHSIARVFPSPSTRKRDEKEPGKRAAPERDEERGDALGEP